jgi:hypothetical protein
MAPFFLDIRFKGQNRRLWVLSIGLVLPAVALIATGVFAMRILYPFYINSVPALYASGFQSYEDDGAVEFGNLVYIGPSPAFVVLSICQWIIYRERKRMLSKSISTLLERLLDPVFGLFGSSENKTSVDDTSMDGA